MQEEETSDRAGIPPKTREEFLHFDDAFATLLSQKIMKNPLTNRTARRNCTRSFTLIFPLLKNNMVYRTKDTTPNA